MRSYQVETGFDFNSLCADDAANGDGGRLLKTSPTPTRALSLGTSVRWVIQTNCLQKPGTSPIAQPACGRSWDQVDRSASSPLRSRSSRRRQLGVAPEAIVSRRPGGQASVRRRFRLTPGPSPTQFPPPGASESQSAPRATLPIRGARPHKSAGSRRRLPPMSAAPRKPHADRVAPLVQAALDMAARGVHTLEHFAV